MKGLRGERRLRVLLLFAPMLILLAGCAAAPVQEMSNARQAIAAAEDAGAETHAQQPLEQARDLLASAESKLQQRNYRGAKDDALGARIKAVQALEISSRAGERDR